MELHDAPTQLDFEDYNPYNAPTQLDAVDRDEEHITTRSKRILKQATMVDSNVINSAKSQRILQSTTQNERKIIRQTTVIDSESRDHQLKTRSKLLRQSTFADNSTLNNSNDSLLPSYPQGTNIMRQSTVIDSPTLQNYRTILSSSSTSSNNFKTWKKQYSGILKPSQSNFSTFLLHSGLKVSIGRKAESEYYINKSFISSKHCTIFTSESNSQVYIKDLSFNGTFVNGVRIEKLKEVLLHHDDTITLVPDTKDLDVPFFVFKSAQLYELTEDDFNRWIHIQQSPKPEISLGPLLKKQKTLPYVTPDEVEVEAEKPEEVSDDIVKPKCKYGKKCYRKNSKHLLDFEH